MSVTTNEHAQQLDRIDFLGKQVQFAKQAIADHNSSIKDREVQAVKAQSDFLRRLSTISKTATSELNSLPVTTALAQRLEEPLKVEPVVTPVVSEPLDQLVLREFKDSLAQMAQQANSALSEFRGFLATQATQVPIVLKETIEHLDIAPAKEPTVDEVTPTPILPDTVTETLLEELLPTVVPEVVKVEEAVTPAEVEEAVTVLPPGPPFPALVGEWVPLLPVTGSGIISIDVTNAKYSKTGQMVFCTFEFIVASITDVLDTEVVTLGGLPFTSVADANTTGSTYFSYFTMMTPEIVILDGTVLSNSTVANLWITKNIGQSMTPLTAIDIKVGSTMTGTIGYLSAA